MATYLVTGLKAAVVLALLLHGVISQMNHAVRCVLEVVLSATCTKVSVGVPVSLQVAIHCCGHSIASNIELSALIKKRLLNIFLDDITAPMAVNLLCLNERSYVIKVTTNLNSTATICVLTRFDNPQ